MRMGFPGGTQFSSKRTHIIIPNVAFFSRYAIIEAGALVVGNNSRFSVLPDNEHGRELHSWKKLGDWKRRGPTINRKLFITENAKDVEISIFRNEIFFYFFLKLFPFAFMERPETLLKSSHDGTNKGLVRMIGK